MLGLEMDPPLNCSVMYAELWNSHTDICGFGVVGCSKILEGSIEERVKLDHVPRHVMGPFENLGLNVDQQCI
jgi:hypothetical protein